MARNPGARQTPSTGRLVAGTPSPTDPMVGIVVPDVANPMFPVMIRAMEDQLETRGFAAVFAETRDSPRRQAQVVDMLLRMQVRGLILASARRHEPIVQRCRTLGIPVVGLNRVPDEPGCPGIGPANRAGIGLAVAHLVRLGHRRIAHVAGPQTVSTGYERRLGYERALLEHGLEQDPRLLSFSIDYTIEEGRRACVALLAGGASFTAIVAANDLIALGCCHELAAQGLRCPEDVAVTGFNDLECDAGVSPVLTSVSIGYAAMARRAADLLLAEIAGVAAPPPPPILPQLVVRRTCGAGQWG